MKNVFTLSNSPFPRAHSYFLFVIAGLFNALSDQLILIYVINVNGDINAPKPKLLTIDDTLVMDWNAK